jgi:hypothetical protein
MARPAAVAVGYHRRGLLDRIIGKVLGLFELTPHPRLQPHTANYLFALQRTELCAVGGGLAPRRFRASALRRPQAAVEGRGVPFKMFPE